MGRKCIMDDAEAEATIDLHMHSIASDGTDSIQELLKKVRSAGIRTFSLTDHDTIDGVVEMETVVPEDMTFIRGIEFSCITAAGKCHILGYGYDKDAQAFIGILQLGKEKRRDKLRRRFEFLSENFGIEIPEAEREMLFSKNSVGKPHLGNLLVSMGLAENKDAAIEKYINPCKTGSNRLPVGDVIRAILTAGGIPVWAHPYGGTGERVLSQEEFEQQLHIMLEAGVRGLECFYSEYNADQVASLVGTARGNGLLISGGSDYHGANKKVALGTLNAYGGLVTEDEITILKKVNTFKSYPHQV